MKIGILTLPLHTNYGGILQAYALQTVLSRMGYEVCVFDKKRKPEVDVPFVVWVKRWVLKYLFRKPVAPIGQLEDYKRRKKRNIHTWKFADRYIHRYEMDDLKTLNKDEFDAIVVGSDQVWRKEYILNSFRRIDDAFLGFAESWAIQRVAYAPSFGQDIWDYTTQETCRIRELLQKFDAVSVREDSGVVLCAKELGIGARQVVDPTMLLSAEDYDVLISDTKESAGNLLCYVLDMTEEKQASIRSITEQYHLKPFTVNANVEAEWGSANVSIQPPVEQWIRGFKDAEMVITDSFHACVFSIIFDKKFIFLGNTNRGNARIESLLHIFGSDPGKNRLSKLEAFRMEGMDYLRKTLCLK